MYCERNLDQFNPLGGNNPNGLPSYMQKAGVETLDSISGNSNDQLMDQQAFKDDFIKFDAR